VPPALLTVGHSNRSLEAFVALLRGAGVELVCDVRAAPRSRHVPHFDRPGLRAALPRARIAYRYEGAALGGRPRGEAHAGPPVPRPGFAAALARVAAWVREGRRVALLCAEEDPARCHRLGLLTPAFERDGGLRVEHLRGDGSIETTAAVHRRLAGGGQGQGLLFE